MAAVVFNVSTSRTTNLFILILLSQSGATIATDSNIADYRESSDLFGL